MFLEALSALADDLSYYQDRIAGEAFLETATERRSVVRHARVVDYEPRPATAARVLLQFDVTAAGTIPAGLGVSAQSPDGEIIPFETGRGLTDTANTPVSPRWNRGALVPYLWDDRQRCLPAGATEVWVQGQGFGLAAGQRLLLDTRAVVAADPPTREVVRLVGSEEAFDPLFGAPPGTPVTRLVWRAEDALRRHHDLDRTAIAGNLLVATQGRRFETCSRSTRRRRRRRKRRSPVVRTGPRTAPEAAAAPPPPAARQYLHTLARAPLAWLAPESDHGGRRAGGRSAAAAAARGPPRAPRRFPAGALGTGRAAC
jgi:hypothetical protein